jgi:hypothetical protein
MALNRFHFLVGFAALTSLLFIGCGGGGAGTQAQSGGGGTDSQTLVWDSPKNFADGVSIDPRRDIDHYEIFLRTDPNFNDTDLPVVQVAAISEVASPGGITYGKKPTTEFSLEPLLPHTQPGKRYYVSIKAVGVDGLKSGFMPPVEWDLS